VVALRAVCNLLLTSSRCAVLPSSEGLVAYYLSEFKTPLSQAAAVDNAMASMDKLVEKEQRTVFRAGSSLLFEDAVSSCESSRLLFHVSPFVRGLPVR